MSIPPVVKSPGDPPDYGSIIPGDDPLTVGQSCNENTGKTSSMKAQAKTRTFLPLLAKQTRGILQARVILHFPRPANTTTSTKDTSPKTHVANVPTQVNHSTKSAHSKN